MYYQDIENKPKGSNLAHLFVAVDPSNLPTLPETQDVTTPQVWGPFYSAGAPFRAKLSPVGVTGKPLLIKGRVYAKDTRKPIPFAVLDLWQASHKGGEKGGHYDYHEEGPERRKYTEDENTVGKVKYTKDFNTVGKAKNFDFRGKALCNSSGEYEVETIIPAPYLDDEFEEPPGVWRCPHIHFFVTSPGYTPLVTQMYLKGHIGTPGGYPDVFAAKTGGTLEKELVEIKRDTPFGELTYSEVVFDLVLASPQ